MGEFIDAAPLWPVKIATPVRNSGSGKMDLFKVVYDHQLCALLLARAILAGVGSFAGKEAGYAHAGPRPE